MRLLTILILSSFTLYAQDYPRQSYDLLNLTDDIIGFQDNEINEDLYENYVQLISNPINLNTATADELRLLNILSEQQLAALTEHIKKYGRLISIYELQAVPGYDLTTIYKIIPFVIVTDPATELNNSFLRRIIEDGSTYFVTRYERTLEEKQGYLEEDTATQFLGTPDKVYARFRTSRPNDFSFGFTTEKDAGEKISWNPKAYQYGMDYWSFHGQVSNKRRIKNLIVGDYQCQFGQGLLLGSAFGLGKGGESITTVRKSNVGFLPYTSVNEAGYLRGIATTIGVHKKIFVSGFYSSTRRDATVTIGELPSFSSLSVTGLHRNNHELRQRKVFAETNYGAVFHVKSTALDAGLIFQAIHFGIPVSKEPTAYNQHAFLGDENFNGSIFFNYTIRNVVIFAEAGKSLYAGTGVVAGALATLHPKIDVAIVGRNYTPNFYTFYANSFSENTTAQNERGMYWGLKYRINRNYSFNSYADLFSFPWLKSRTYRPSVGKEIMLRFNYQPSRKIIMYAQFRQENKERNQTDNLKRHLTATGVKRNVLLNFDYTLSQFLRMKTRGQFSEYTFDQSSTKGMAVLQDISLTLGKIQLTARHALFDTEDFDNRQYAYENDVWLAYSLPAYAGTGIRNYVMLEYKINKQVGLWLRYSRMKYNDRMETGTGVDQINGNKTSDLKVQVKVSL